MILREPVGNVCEFPLSDRSIGTDIANELNGTDRRGFTSIGSVGLLAGVVDRAGESRQRRDVGFADCELVRRPQEGQRACLCEVVRRQVIAGEVGGSLGQAIAGRLWQMVQDLAVDPLTR